MTSIRLVLRITVVIALQLFCILVTSPAAAGSLIPTILRHYNGAGSCPFVGCNCTSSDQESRVKVNCSASAAATLPFRIRKYRNAGRVFTIYLSHLNLTELPADLFTNLNVAHLDLSANRLHMVHKDALEPLRGTLLQILDLSHNNITRLDASTFGHFRGLQYLNLSSNQISFVHSDAFANCAALVELDLSFNRLTLIPARLVYSLVQLERVLLHSQQAALLRIDDYAFERVTSHHHPHSFGLVLDEHTIISPRAFCSPRVRSWGSWWSSSSASASSSFAHIRYILQLKAHKTAHTAFNSCLFAQLQHRHRTRLTDGEVESGNASWSACKCQPLTLEEEKTWCAGVELGEAQRKCWTPTSTSTTTKITPRWTRNKIERLWEKGIILVPKKTATVRTTTQITIHDTTDITMAKRIKTFCAPISNFFGQFFKTTSDNTFTTTTTTTSTSTTTIITAPKKKRYIWKYLHMG